jgi:diguanylate cyclase (GGDEF)-like protein
MSAINAVEAAAVARAQEPGQGAALQLLAFRIGHEEYGIDIPRVQEINDNFGHPSGYAVLSALSKTIRYRLRSADVFPRLGREEFGVILFGTGEAGAVRAEEDLRSEVQAPYAAKRGGRNRAVRHSQISITD